MCVRVYYKGRRNGDEKRYCATVNIRVMLVMIGIMVVMVVLIMMGITITMVMITKTITMTIMTIIMILINECHFITDHTYIPDNMYYKEDSNISALLL